MNKKNNTTNTKIVRSDNRSFPTDAIKIEGLAEISADMLSNNDSIPISTQEGTKKIPLHRIKTKNKKLTLAIQDIISSLRVVTKEEILLNDLIILDGLGNILEEDIAVILPSDIQEGTKILLYSRSASQNHIGFLVKQDNTPLLRINRKGQKEELIFLDGQWQNIHSRSSSGLIGLDVSLVGDPNTVLLYKDFLLPYNGKTYSQLDYPELCMIKKHSGDWKFNDESQEFTIPDYTNYFLRYGDPASQGKKKNDTMRKIVGKLQTKEGTRKNFAIITQATSAFTVGRVITKVYKDGYMTQTNGSNAQQGELTFDSSKGVEGQEGSVSPNVGSETAPMHICTTLYVIAK